MKIRLLGDQEGKLVELGKSDTRPRHGRAPTILRFCLEPSSLFERTHRLPGMDASPKDGLSRWP